MLLKIPFDFSGITDHPTFCKFNVSPEAESSYPYSIKIELGFTLDQKNAFVAALNKKWPNLAKLTVINDNSFINLDLEFVTHKIMSVNGPFETHLREKMSANPLLLRAYLMLSHPHLKINTDDNATYKLFQDIFGFDKHVLVTKANMLEYVLLKAFHINEPWQDAGYFEPGNATKLADAEAIMTFELVISAVAIQENVVGEVQKRYCL